MSLTVWYLLVALLGALIAWCWSFSILAPLDSGHFATGAVLAWVHLAVLGSLLTAALGVMIQLVPIAFQAPPLPTSTPLWHLPLHVAAITMMIVGFLNMDFTVVGIGGSLLLLNTGILLGLVYNSYRKARNKTPVHRAMRFAVAGLPFVMGIGVWQAFQLPGTGSALLLGHIALGTLWYWGGLVIVISYKFIPMFTLSHGYEVDLRTTTGLYFGGVTLVATAATLPHTVRLAATLVGGVFVIGGALLFALDLQRMVRVRKRKRIMFPILSAIAATLSLLGALTLLVTAYALGDERIGVAAGDWFYFGGMIPLLLAYAQKIIPFLRYEYRYSHAPDRKSAPLIDEMVPALLSRVGTYLYVISFCASLLYFLFLARFTPVLRHWLALTLAAIGAAALAIMARSLIHVLLVGGKRPDLPRKT